MISVAHFNGMWPRKSRLVTRGLVDLVCFESLDSSSHTYCLCGQLIDDVFMPLTACMGLCGCRCMMILLCVCWNPSRWQTSQVSGCWPQAAGSWAAKGIPAAGSYLCLILWPTRHHLSDLQPGSARITLRQQETPQQQGEFGGGLFLKSSLELNLAFHFLNGCCS